MQNSFPTPNSFLPQMTFLKSVIPRPVGLAVPTCRQSETRSPAPVPSVTNSAFCDNGITSGLQAPHILPLPLLVRGKPRQDELHIPSCSCLPRKRNPKPVAKEGNQILRERMGMSGLWWSVSRGAKPEALVLGKAAYVQITPGTTSGPVGGLDSQD